MSVDPVHPASERGNRGAQMPSKRELSRYEFAIPAGPDTGRVSRLARAVAEETCRSSEAWNVRVEGDVVLVSLPSHRDWFAFVERWRSL